MKSYYKKVLILCSFNIFLKLGLVAQEYDAWDIAKENINRLNKGVLLIQLKSDHNLLEALDIELEKGDQKYKSKVQRKIDQTIQERDSFNYYMIQGMKKNYHFSKVLFFYDQEMNSMAKSNYLGIHYLDEQLQKTINKEADTSSIYIMLQDLSETQSLESWTIYNDKMVRLKLPFPFYLRKNNFNTVIFSIFNKKEKIKLETENYSKKWNDKLFKFYKLEKQSKLKKRFYIWISYR